MRLCAIYNVWSDCIDLLEKSIENIIPVVDGVIVIYSHTSNYGQRIEFVFPNSDILGNPKVTFIRAEPIPGHLPSFNETIKRNFGIDKAKKEGYTHCLIMDSDEFYIQDEVRQEKARIERDNLNGLVCRLKVYIAKPTLWCEDHTLIPFIQKLTKEVSVGDFKWYPFAYDEQRQAHIDPTRRPSHRDKVEMSDIYMHHFSYVRKDMELKISSSTANLRRSREVIYRDLENAKPGYISELYHRELKECEDIFNIKNAKIKETEAS